MGDDKETQPLPPQSWERAPVLVPALAPLEPPLISDGGGLPFSPGRPFEELPPLDEGDPAVAALIVALDRARRQEQPARLLRPRPKPPPMETAQKLAGWHELARAQDEVLFGRGLPPRLLTVAVRRARGGGWAPLGASNSRELRAVKDGARASSWRPDPAEPGDPRQARILVTELTIATGALAADRLLEPEIHLAQDRVVLRVYVKPLEGYVGRTRRRETPVVVRLPEPLGGRELVDGAVWSAAGQRTSS